MAITKVTIWKTTKGEICDSEESAKLAEKLDITKDSVQELIEREIAYFDEQTIIFDFIMGNRVQLLKILG